MKSVIASLVAVAGLSVAANAQVGSANTQMDMLVSTDGTTFSNSVNATPGQTVQIQVRVTYTGPAVIQRAELDPNDPNGTATRLDDFIPRGLASLVFQPVIGGNLLSSDTSTAFNNGGAGSNTSSPSGVVTNVAGNYGRITPFGRTAITGLTAFTANPGAPAGNWIRVAQPQVSNWFGGAGNTSGGSGVNIAQLALVGRTGTDPAFAWKGVGNVVNTQIAIFRFGVTVGAGHAVGDTLTVDAPYAGFGNIDTDGGTGDRQVYWWGLDRTVYDETLGLADGTNPGANSDVHSFITESTGSMRGVATVNTGAIHIIVPTPASLALLGLGGLVVGRRRR